MDLYNKKGEQRPHNVISKMFDFLVFFSNHGTALVHVTYYWWQIEELKQTKTEEMSSKFPEGTKVK